MQIMHEGLEQRNMPMRRVEVIEKNIKELEQHNGKGKYMGTLMW